MHSTNEKNQNATLICWIGDTDLLAFGKFGLTTQNREYFLTAKRVWENDKKDSSHSFDAEVEKLNLATRNSSIVLTLDHCEENGMPKFRNILLLTNRPSNDAKLLQRFQDLYASYIRTQYRNHHQCDSSDWKITVSFIPAESNPSIGVNGWNYQEVFTATRKFLSRYSDTAEPDGFWYNVTPGTIAQSTTLILVAKGLSRHANFIQVEKSKQRVEHCEIPFDISALIDQYAASVATQSERTYKIVGSAPCFLNVLNQAKKIAVKQVTVLITGPSGAGKELIAREIHRLSGRPADKFVAINCAMLSKETGVTALTGYFKGAYTGADQTTPGQFEAAKGGTLFLDEVGDCPADVQAELLRFLQPPPGAKKPTEREWVLKGVLQASDKAGHAYKGIQRGDIRVIAATNRDQDLLDPTKFRQDLYYRLETIQIKLPSLEDRKKETDNTHGIDDIRLLADSILQTCNENYIDDKAQYRRFDESAYKALHQHRWTGNVRELQNVITRVVIMSDATAITGDDIIQNLNPNKDATLTAANESADPPKTSFEDLVAQLAEQDLQSGHIPYAQREKEFKHAYCTAALKICNGNKSRAYKRINVNARAFNNALDITDSHQSNNPT